MSRPWPWANQWKMRDIEKWDRGEREFGLPSASVYE